MRRTKGCTISQCRKMPLLWFIWHGQATHNVDALIRGEHAYFDPINTDAALTKTGIQQAIEAGYFSLPDADIGPFQAIYCSPSLRCRQTLHHSALEHTKRCGVQLVDRLMEPQGDAACNKRSERTELVETVPAGWNLSGVGEVNPFSVWREGYSMGGDGYGHFAARVRDFTEKILRKHRFDERILIVSHHDWIRTWFREMLDQSVAPANCEVLTATWPPVKVDWVNPQATQPTG